MAEDDTVPILGIILGSVLGILGLMGGILAGMFLYRRLKLASRRRNAKNQEEEDDDESDDSGYSGGLRRINPFYWVGSPSTQAIPAGPSPYVQAPVIPRPAPVENPPIVRRLIYFTQGTFI